MSKILSDNPHLNATGLLKRMESVVPCHNFSGSISSLTLSNATIETPLFPLEALTFYAMLNLNEIDMSIPEHAEMHKKWYSPERGGPQGDYRAFMTEKVANVINALTLFPKTKRAVLTVPNRSIDHTVDEDAKCLRELHFFIEDGKLHCSGFMRAQACSIFPKNIFFISYVMAKIAKSVGMEVGSYSHFVTTLTSGRE